MAAPFGHLAFTWDGSDYQTPETGLYLYIVRGFNEFADVRGEDTIVPSVDGRIFQNRRPDRRTITINGYIWGWHDPAGGGDPYVDFRVNFDTVRSAFAPTNEPVVLAVTTESGGHRRLDARGVNMMVNEVVPSLFAEVSIDCESVTPGWTAY